MPIIQMNMMENRTAAQKQELARRVCEAVCQVLDAKPESVRIMIHELGPHDFSVGGVTMAERKSGKEDGVPGND
tara:strand:+ start:100646 stop:100867 length:222 start_codon:yes stop_codon:yes gene_type:complete